MTLDLNPEQAALLRLALKTQCDSLTRSSATYERAGDLDGSTMCRRDRTTLEAILTALEAAR